jgi:hypothetical protein
MIKMKFKERLTQLGEKFEPQVGTHKFDEARTKLLFINPFIEILGYKTSEQADVIAEFPADFATRARDKVDYVLRKDGVNILMIECKRFHEKVSKHGHQLNDYFHNLHEVRFGILTNGIIYHFYTDTDFPNTMDSEPFFEFNVTDFNDEQVSILEMFCKENFEEKSIIEKAKKLTYSQDIRKVLYNEMTNPSKDFIKYIAEKAYLEKKRGSITERVRNLYAELVNLCLPMVINKLISDKMIRARNHPDNKSNETESKIITTEEEREAYFIVKSIIRRKVSSERVNFKDSQAYFSIRVDDSSHKTICRLYLNSNKKFIGIFDMNRKETKIEIESIDNIFDYSEQLLESASIFENKNV